MNGRKSNSNETSKTVFNNFNTCIMYKQKLEMGFSNSKMFQTWNQRDVMWLFVKYKINCPFFRTVIFFSLTLPPPSPPPPPSIASLIIMKCWNISMARRNSLIHSATVWTIASQMHRMTKSGHLYRYTIILKHLLLNQLAINSD